MACCSLNFAIKYFVSSQKHSKFLSSVTAYMYLVTRNYTKIAPNANCIAKNIPNTRGLQSKYHIKNATKLSGLRHNETVIHPQHIPPIPSHSDSKLFILSCIPSKCAVSFYANVIHQTSVTLHNIFHKNGSRTSDTIDVDEAVMTLCLKLTNRSGDVVRRQRRSGGKNES